MSASKQIYDDFAEDYEVVWKSPAVKHLFPLLHSKLMELNVCQDAKVLDLACGTGIGLREAQRLGASSSVGVDISKAMIDVCKQNTTLGDHVQLHVADCSESLNSLGLEPDSFNLVLGMWLLNYAESAERMQKFWNNIALYLAKDGVFVGIIQNQDTIHPSSVHDFKYGARETAVTPLPSQEGYKMHIEFDTVPKVEFDAYVLNKDIFEETAAKAGLKIDAYVRPDKTHLTEAERQDIDWWQELLDEYPNQLVIASKI